MLVAYIFWVAVDLNSFENTRGPSFLHVNTNSVETEKTKNKTSHQTTKVPENQKT